MKNSLCIGSGKLTPSKAVKKTQNVARAVVKPSPVENFLLKTPVN